MSGPTVWYRVEGRQYAAPLDEFDEPRGGGSVDVQMTQIPVLKETPKGVWLDLGWSSKRFVLRGATKRWACPTESEAVESFCARKVRQISILREQTASAERMLRLAELRFGSGSSGAGAAGGTSA